MVKLDYVVTNGYVDRDTILSRAKDGWEFVVTLPASLIMPKAMPTDKITIFSKDEGNQVTLEYFLRHYIAENSRIRLWKHIEGHNTNYMRLSNSTTCTREELLQGEVHQSKYLDSKFVCIATISPEDFLLFKEAINIVIDIK